MVLLKLKRRRGGGGEGVITHAMKQKHTHHTITLCGILIMYSITLQSDFFSDIAVSFSFSLFLLPSLFLLSLSQKLKNSVFERVSVCVCVCVLCVYARVHTHRSVIDTLLTLSSIILSECLQLKHFLQLEEYKRTKEGGGGVRKTQRECVCICECILFPTRLVSVGGGCVCVCC